MAAAAAAANAALIARMQAQIDALVAAQAVVPAAPVVAAPGMDAAHNALLISLMRRQLIPPPANFRGDLGLEARNWLIAIDRYFEAAGIVDDATKLQTAGMHLTGAAQVWWTANRDLPAADAARITTWAAFPPALRARFEPVDILQWGRSEITKLINSNLQVRPYTERFLSLSATVTDMAEADRIYQYKLGLHSSIREKFALKQHLTLQTAAEDAIRLDAARVTAGAPAASNPSSTSSSRFQQFRQGSSSSRLNQIEDPTPAEDNPPIEERLFELMTQMETRFEARLNALQASKPAHQKQQIGGSGRAPQKPHPYITPGVSGAEAKARRDRGHCIRCDQPGHLKRECPAAQPVPGK
jgi:hypothetical protein